MTDREILNEIKTIFIEKMRIHQRFKNLNAKLLWREIEPRISIPALRTHYQKGYGKMRTQEPAVKIIQAGHLEKSVGIGDFLPQNHSQLSKDERKDISQLLTESINEAFTGIRLAGNIINRVQPITDFLKDIAIRLSPLVLKSDFSPETSNGAVGNR